jgi:hypothetical protein
MPTQKKQKKPQTSLYEVIRHELNLEKFELAHMLGHPRQWYTRKKSPNCQMTVVDLWRLFKASKMTSEQFVKAIAKANGER